MTCGIQQRMHRAVYLLRDINQSVTEVGRAVGYEDIYHFSKLFKRHIGIAPEKPVDSFWSGSSEFGLDRRSPKAGA